MVDRNTVAGAARYCIADSIGLASRAWGKTPLIVSMAPKPKGQAKVKETEGAGSRPEYLTGKALGKAEEADAKAAKDSAKERAPELRTT